MSTDRVLLVGRGRDAGNDRCHAEHVSTAGIPGPPRWPGGDHYRHPVPAGVPPRESVVAVGLRGRRSRVCVTLRFDLPTADANDAAPVDGDAPAPDAAPAELRVQSSDAALAELIVDQLRRAGAEQAVVVVLTEVGDPTPARPSLAAALDSSLRRARIGVRDLLSVRGGRWWSYLCEEPSCCPPEGRPVPESAPDALVAAMVVEGRVVHPSRDELAATIATAPRDDEAAWRRRFADAEEHHRQRAVPAIARHTVFGEIEAAVRARAETSSILADDDAARFCVALSEVQLRDACLRWLEGPLADAAEALWRELVRAAAPPYVAAPATLLGLHAYARGDGTLARICLERALAGNPVYTLALLVREGLDGGIPPEAIRKLAACVESAEADA